jgi:hypothetical protein
MRQPIDGEKEGFYQGYSLKKGIDIQVVFPSK